MTRPVASVLALFIVTLDAAAQAPAAPVDDGWRILIHSTRSPKEGEILFTMRADGSDVTSIGGFDKLERCCPYAYLESQQSWTWELPPALRKVFTEADARRADGSSGLFISDLDGGNRNRIDIAGGSAVAPLLSPDGSQVAFLRLSLEGGYDLVVVRIGADGGVEERVVVAGFQGSHFWAPDGKSLGYYGRFAGDPEPAQVVRARPGARALPAEQLGTLTLDGKRRRNLWRPPSCSGMTFAPDGRHIAAWVENELCVVDLPETGADPVPQVVASRPGSSRTFGWSPDGTRIAVTCHGAVGSDDFGGKGKNESDEVFLVDLKGGRKNLTKNWAVDSAYLWVKLK